MNAISINNLTVKYKKLVAVNDISFNVAKGEIFGIIGPNGAGKTSALESMEGLGRPAKGNIQILDIEEGKWREIHKKIGIQLQETRMQDNLKVTEICELYQSFYDDPADYRGLLDMFELADSKQKLIKRLSGGQRQKLAIVLALIGNPEILFLDEISNGLDPYARVQIWNKIKELRDNGKTIIITTHYMEEAELLCDRVCMMVGGTIKAMGTLNDLILQADLPIRITLEIPDDKINLIEMPADVDGTATERGVRIDVRAPMQISAAISAISSQAEILDIDIAKPSLEDVFFKLTGAALGVTS